MQIILMQTILAYSEDYAKISNYFTCKLQQSLITISKFQRPQFSPFFVASF